ncbi:hypothetical protein J2X92_000085 [Variovorax paradoxus]|nr:hypothetical protein [Variovorax paradoxus]MDP9927892.1 hypothetical protein [Variovorax paradoxus]
MYDDPGSITNESTRLTTTLNRSLLRYVYDFGDYWDYRIKVEKKIAPIPGFVLPVLCRWCLRNAAGGLRRRAGYP